MVYDSNDETNFSLKLLLTNTQVSTTGKSFANGSAANIKLSQPQRFKIIQLEGFYLFILCYFELKQQLTATVIPYLKNI